MRKFYIGAVSVLVLVGLVFAYWSISNRAYSAENALEASYQRGYYNLQDQVSNIDLLLSKALGTSSAPMQVMTLTSVWHLSEGARESLSSLPLDRQDMMTSQKFFAQLGDYSYNLCKKLVQEEQITEEQWEQIRNFKKNTSALAQELKNLTPQTIGKIDWKKKELGIAQSFANIEERLKKEAPTITYDGPFSDHVENIKPRGLTGEEIDSAMAVKKAAEYASAFSNAKYDIQVNNRVKGNIPAFNLSLVPQGRSDHQIIMDISETGGHLLWFINSRRVGEEEVEIKEALERAEEFLAKLDFENFTSTGSLRDGNVLTVTFVPEQEGVLLYPDYIKVQVALDNGEILGADMVEYRKSHVRRNFPEAKISEEEALESLKEDLEVKRVRRALIPTPSRREVLCYEIDATSHGEQFFIYIDMETGQEQEILKIVETDRGTMTL